MKSGLRRLTARCATAALVGTVALTGATAAQAWTLGSQIGTATVDPATGVDAVAPTISTSGPCDAVDNPMATNAQLYIFGAGFQADGYPVSANNPTSILPTNPAGGYDVPLIDTFQNIALAQDPPVTYTGTYSIVLVCKHSFGQADYGDYVTSVSWIDPQHYQSGAAAVATTTTLAASPSGTAAPGSPVTLTATVTPAGATGSVQFLDGAASLGTATVAGDHAQLVTAALPQGPHTLSAVFTPTAPAGATASTSAALAYSIAAPAPAPAPAKPVLGAYPSSLMLPVGAVLTCPLGTKLTLPAGDLGKAIYCNTGGPFILVDKGSAPVALVAPRLAGTGKVGSKLALQPGVWSPAFTSRTVTWKRDGKSIAGQTGATYTVRKTDKGHKITATMVAHLAGHLDGTASTPAVKAHLLGTRGDEGTSLTALAQKDGIPGDTTAVGVPVGTPIGCFAADFTGATSISAGWLVDGTAYTAPAAFVIPDGLLGHTLTCRTTATNAGGSTVSDAVVTVGNGAALLSYVAPKVTGIGKVGKKLSASAGKWSPVFGRASYVWLRNGVAIKGATKASYLTTAADKKHRISVRVTVTRDGWGPGSATSAAVSIA